jgi:hypothetical protein
MSEKAIRMFLEGESIADIVDRTGLDVSELVSVLDADGIAHPGAETLIGWEAEERGDRR